ncbi:UDP-glucose dehydrogenase family protein [Aurantimonas marina]|uniref:UDP-glucose dehydrogenase family protein n=1 Tax=Aurantimonas marina TaxID=2780508 RepID=UPI0019D018D3|nr:UDP-glucose/GDP-mannose dehydrogenase family protein [Aurantimonas marina]
MMITVIGSGYVGLVAGACLAELGNDVVCIDTDPAKIDMLRRGQVPIFEPGLEPLLQRGQQSGRLEFTTDYDLAVGRSTIFLIAVGTPPEEDGSADLRHVLSAAAAIGERLTQKSVIVNKSTVPVDTAAKVEAVIADRLRSRGVEVEFAVVSNPEFLKEGAAIEDFTRPDRIIIGSSDTWATEVMRNLYAPLNRRQDKIIVMDPRSAELTKYAANAMLATRISFMNELAHLSEAVGADIEAVRRGIGSDPRIGFRFLYPGSGYGGSCFPKDARALIRMGAEREVPLRVMHAVEEANERQKHALFEKLAAFYGGARGLDGKTIALWGLSFKPDTDDMREAPSCVLIEDLLSHGAQVRAYDPAAMKQTRQIFADASRLTLCPSAADALEGSDALAIVTEWREFRSPDFDEIASRLKDKAVFDGRNMYERSATDAAGLAYFDIGRNPVEPRER